VLVPVDERLASSAGEGDYEINEHCHNSQVGQRGYLLGTMLKIEANLPTLNALESNPFPPAGRY
jgi:hypothetical protein